MTEITISSHLVSLPWQYREHDWNLKHVFLYTDMLSLNNEENINIIKILNFSQNLRPNKGLINPSPFPTRQNLSGVINNITPSIYPTQ